MPAHRTPHRHRFVTCVRAGVVALLCVISLAAASAVYEVQPGDTLASIAAEHGVTAAELAAANGVENPDLIRIGQTLEIPGGTDSGDSVGGSTTYTVGEGDTLGAIARLFETTTAAITELNNLTDPDLIRIGQTLTIPDDAATGAPTLHVVVPGDTLATIAARYETTVTAIAEANGITNNDLIYVGASLKVGGSAPPALEPPRPSTGVHVVAEGETLGSIAAAHGMTTAAIIEANGIGDPDLIRVGQELQIPGAGWMCPVPGGTFFNDWGFPRSGGRTHEGTDIFAERGTPVLAPVSGYLHQLTGDIGGKQFRLDGDDGNLYIGTHLEAFGNRAEVLAGAVIGYVGDSGNAMGSEPHLHFEIHPDHAGPVNPYPTLVQYCG